MPWPVATTRFSKASGRPMIGSPSGEQGRRPAHTSSRLRPSRPAMRRRHALDAGEAPLVDRQVEPLKSNTPVRRSRPRRRVTATRDSDTKTGTRGSLSDGS